MVCKYDDFSTSWYKEQVSNLRIHDIYRDHSSRHCDFVNRKFWEWCAIAQVLQERNKLCVGMKGLGFAVGTEPLASHFAARGCQILATDLAEEISHEGWTSTGQHASEKEQLFYHQLVNRTDFDNRVDFQPVDMRELQGISGGYDFIWSSCAIEHLGSLNAGADFIVNSTKLLKPGGVAVHTTEFNVLSNDVTFEVGPAVIYRERDIKKIGKRLSKHKFILIPPDFDVGDHKYDSIYDTEPYMTSGIPHLKFDFHGQISTSMLLIIQRSKENIRHNKGGLFIFLKRLLG